MIRPPEMAVEGSMERLGTEEMFFRLDKAEYMSNCIPYYFLDRSS